MLNVEPATNRLSALVLSVGDGQLDGSTPCDCTVGDLLDHIQNLAGAFAAAAAKTGDESLAGPPPVPDAARLGDDWRTGIPALLARLAAAWREPAAWEGMTRVGGLDMPAEAAGVVALDEVIIHSWDLAVASGQAYDPPAELVERLLPFLEHMAEPGMKAAREGLFGPVLEVDPDSPLFDRVLALAGRWPHWTPS